MTPRWRWCASSASSTSSWPRSVRSAISATVGVRPRAAVRSSTALATSREASFTRRVTWTAQVRSRNHRRSSPSMVGTANVLNERPRSGSKRFTAFTRPTSATCPRSSRLSPRWAKRRAQNDASQLNSSTRALRMSRSPVGAPQREPGVDLVVSGSGWLVQRSSLGAMLRRTRRLPTGEPLTQNRFGESRFDCREKRFPTRKGRSTACTSLLRHRGGGRRAINRRGVRCGRVPQLALALEPDPCLARAARACPTHRRPARRSAAPNRPVRRSGRRSGRCGVCRRPAPVGDVETHDAIRDREVEPDVPRAVHQRIGDQLAGGELEDADDVRQSPGGQRRSDEAARPSHLPCVATEATGHVTIGVRRLPRLRCGRTVFRRTDSFRHARRFPRARQCSALGSGDGWRLPGDGRANQIRPIRAVCRPVAGVGGERDPPPALRHR